MQHVRATLWVLTTLSTAAAQTVLLRDARVIDPRQRKVARGDLRVGGAGILARGRTLVAKDDDTVIDLGGRFVLPGLSDLHVHSWGNFGPGNTGMHLGTVRASRWMLYCGVVRCLDLFRREEEILALRDTQSQRSVPAARIFAAGPMFTAPGGHGTQFGFPPRVIRDAEEARTQVSDLATRRPDVIKIVYDHASRRPTLDRETLNAAVDAARSAGIPSVVHIGHWADAAEALRAGCDAITHLPETPIPDTVVQLAGERHAWWIPTLTVHADLGWLCEHPDELADPLLAEVTSAELREVYRAESQQPRWLRGRAARQNASRANLYRNLRRLAQGGARLLVGTDAGNLGTFQGASVHRELEHWVRAGVSEWDALAAATVHAGEFLGQRVGVDPGDDADLLVLDASPLDDIRNTRRIHFVLRDGAVVDRTSLVHPPARAWTAAVLDDFTTGSPVSSHGVRWREQVDWGGQTHWSPRFEAGALRVSGHIEPTDATGAAWANLVLMLDEAETDYDASAFHGVELVVVDVRGPVAIELLSGAATNFDHPAAALPGGAARAVWRRPFADFSCEGPTPAGFARQLRGVKIGVRGDQPADFSYVIERVALYRESDDR
ncbi:MAG: amidohydrolase family protein [Planctomycetota bacterium]